MCYKLIDPDAALAACCLMLAILLLLIAANDGRAADGSAADGRAADGRAVDFAVLSGSTGCGVAVTGVIECDGPVSFSCSLSSCS